MGFHETEKLSVFYWDDSDGEEYAGWWCGDSIVSDVILGFCKSSAQAEEPPVSGWCFPLNGGVQPTIRFDICEPPAESTLQMFMKKHQDVCEEAKRKQIADS